MDSTRRSLLCLAGAATLLPRAARAATNGPKRILFAFKLPPKGRERIRALFAARGLVDGRNCILAFIERPTNPRDLPAYLGRLAASRPDVLVVGGHDAWFLPQTRDIFE